MKRPDKQQGVALVVAMIMLVVATIIGLSSIRSTTLQERMTANLYDRSVAFQNAETALRAAEISISTSSQILTSIYGVNRDNYDCDPLRPNPIECAPFPENTWSAANSTGWVNITTLPNIPNNFLVNDNLTLGTPQVHIQLIARVENKEETGQSQSANEQQYGSSSASDEVMYFRITARSGDPSVINERAFVALQTTVKRSR
ncbi:MAG: PilX N-terminal domain-containing pilus assembly protein [Nitrincola lacisaponensis]|uniref:pilus assembly PilX family protein n=1 Tax=Nitrincola lacisaponensis TaxID=267850 RepID=UPI00391C6478